MAEKTDVTSGTDDFGRLFRLIRYVSNGYHKSKFALLDTTGQPVPGQHQKIDRGAEQFRQLSNRPIHQMPTGVT